MTHHAIAMSRKELLRSVVDKTIRSRGLRAVVAPSFDQDVLVFRIKGRIIHYFLPVESKNSTLNLRVMNTAGDSQPAGSFLEFMRAVFVEILALRDAFVAEPDLKYCDNAKDWHDELNTIGDSAMHLVLEPLGVPWPLIELIHGSMIDTPVLLRRLVAQNRLEHTLLRLVLSRTTLAGVVHLVEDFVPKDHHLLPKWQDLDGFMNKLADETTNVVGEHFDSFGEPAPDREYDSFRVRCFEDGRAEGKLMPRYSPFDIRWKSGPADLMSDESDDESEGDGFRFDY
jgi:hypothetical protein